jgi:hypothetical protein
MSILLVGQLEQVAKILHTVVRLLLWTADNPDVGALAASVDNCRALVLMRKQFFVGDYFLAALVCVTATELNFA